MPRHARGKLAVCGQAPPPKLIKPIKRLQELEHGSLASLLIENIRGADIAEVCESLEQQHQVCVVLVRETP
jgi:hypothetical protein